MINDNTNERVLGLWWNCKQFLFYLNFHKVKDNVSVRCKATYK